MPYTPDLSLVFRDGYTLRLNTEVDPYSECWLQVRQIAELVLTTGKIVACDPFTLWGTEPFQCAVPPGRYPVLLTIAHYKGGDKREAFASIRFQPEKPVRWEMALLAGQDAGNLEGQQFYGYGVDSGTGCFMDEKAVPLMQSRAKTEEFNDFMIAEMQKTLDATGLDTGNFILNADSGLNMVAFHSGWGDGFYPSFWGLDGKNKVVCLTTDFCLFADEDGKL